MCQVHGILFYFSFPGFIYFALLNLICDFRLQG